MTSTDTPIRQLARRFDFSSAGGADLEAALRLFFGQHVGQVCYCDTERGLRLAILNDSLAMVADGAWRLLEEGEGNLDALVMEILNWLDDLREQGRDQEVCNMMPTEQATWDDPDLALVGFRLASTRSRDGLHSMLTVTPAWV